MRGHDLLAAFAVDDRPRPVWARGIVTIAGRRYWSARAPREMWAIRLRVRVQCVMLAIGEALRDADKGVRG